MSQFREIDPILSGWAMTNAVHWYTEYQDTEVRAFYLKPEREDRVQIAVDAPQLGSTVVRIGQLRQGLSRLSRSEEYPTSVSDLSETLDSAFKISNEWLAESE